jgi:D-inositol-3-phosphate glycosyltransferase
MSEQKKKKLLWIGDAVAQTGFARVTHSVLEHLRHKWDVGVLGINYNGDPTPYQHLYKLFPAVLGGDVWGVGRLMPIIRQMKPDVVLVLNDPWNVAQYLQNIEANIPVVAYLPVDAPNQMAGRALNSLQRAIAYTQFGRKHLILGGYTGRCDIIPHGVDTSIYHPMPKEEALHKLTLSQKIKPNSFVVGVVARNQPRKRLDLTIQAWAKWWIDAGQPDNAYLYMHTTMQDIGWNVLQLATYYGINQQFIVTNPKMTLQNCLLEENMKLVYNAFDVQLHTSLGEGWGLTAHEGMACGIPQIMPKYAALGEWPDGCVRYVPVTSYEVTHNAINTIGGVVDFHGTVEAIDELYKNETLRRDLGERGLARAREERFKWETIAEQFDAILSETVLEGRQSPVGLEVGR